MDEATAFVPGHLAGFSGVHRADDPTEAGASGGGLVVSDGVRVTVGPADEGDLVVELNGDPAEFGAVSRVLRALRVPGARVEAETPLAPGTGFGVTGALALGTALAANAAFGRALSADELVTVAHGAEVQAGTGLGDVVAQARGGVPLRLEPGGPQANVMDGIPARPRIEYHSLGGLDTDTVLTEAGQEVTTAGEADHYAAGDRVVTFRWSDCVVAPSVCYDIRFPELYRDQARSGAQLMVVIANFPAVREAHWLGLLTARAIENQAYVLGVNRCGDDPHKHYTGRSQVIDPRGEVLADAGEEPGVVSTEIDLAELTAYREKFPVLRDMRG